MSLLTVENLAVRFGDSVGVQDVSFHVRKGETVALVGESGSGKSLSALSTAGLVPANAQLSGSVRYQGRDIIGADARELRKLRGNDISFIFQEPMTSLNPLHTLERQISESLALHQGLHGAKARERIIELLDQVGIRDPKARLQDFPHQLSGGQRQRVMIAMALANKPELLVADEPTTALDVTIQAQILELLQQIQHAEQMAMLFITHDLGIVRRIADRVYVMQNGVIVESGTTRDILSHPSHPYTKMLLAAEPTGRPQPIGASAQTVLESENLRVWFPIKRGLFKRTVGHIKAMNSVDLTVREGETVGIVGESGSGKTTLALAVLRLISAQGAIHFDGQRIDKLKNRALKPLRNQIQIVFQDPYGSLSPRMTIGQIIAEGLQVHGKLSRQQRKEAVDEVMQEVGLDPQTVSRYPHEFSGGQRQRIAIARALILRPKMLVLDEPTSALDRTVQAQIVDLLRDLQAKHGISYLFISHDLKVVRALSHKVMVMKQGDVVEAGDSDQIFQYPRTDYTRRLINAAFDLQSDGLTDQQ